MRTTLLFLLVLCACARLTEPRTSTAVQMQLGAGCAKLVPQPLTFELSVDGKVVGSAKLGAGDTSPAFAITQGQHALSAAAPGQIWFGAVIVQVPAEGVILLLPCPGFGQLK